MSISVELSNLGPLRSAQMELGDLNLLIGENNTGKTFFATVLHRVLDAKPEPEFRLDRLVQPTEVPVEVQEWIMRVLDDPNGDSALHEEFTRAPSDETVEWATNLAKNILERYASNVRDRVEYAFGAQASELRRRTPNGNAGDSYLRIGGSQRDWEVEVRFDSDASSVTLLDPVGWLQRALHPKLIQRTTLFRNQGRQGWPDKSRRRHLDDTTDQIAFSMLFLSWPNSATHLPADRTGIMQSQSVLAGLVIRQATRAGIRPIKSGTLTGTAADFLSLVLEIPKLLFDVEYEPSIFDPLVNEFEEDLQVAIEVDASAEGVDSIVAVTSEGRFPMARASSMLSELAPLLLVLRSHYFVDHLTIDEPEAHLHPAMQMSVASFLAKLVNNGVRIVLTTHSDFFVTQFNNMMRVHELSDSAENPFGLPSIDRSRVRCLRFSRENGACVAQSVEPDRIDGVDESTFTDVMRAQYNTTSQLVNDLIDSSNE